ncbi:hypothetical protein A1F94_013838 [Pyrenophora tritici-repentis]|nr:hypothetical protein A1F94_013838 [Pyrenophora tritici-repentis]
MIQNFASAIAGRATPKLGFVTVIPTRLYHAYDPSSIATTFRNTSASRLPKRSPSTRRTLRGAHVHQKAIGTNSLDLQQRKRSIAVAMKEAKENNRIYQLKIKEAARAAREEAKKVDEAKAVKAAELDAKRRDRDAAKAIQQPHAGFAATAKNDAWCWRWHSG